MQQYWRTHRAARVVMLNTASVVYGGREHLELLIESDDIFRRLYIIHLSFCTKLANNLQILYFPFNQTPRLSFRYPIIMITKIMLCVQYMLLSSN